MPFGASSSLYETVSKRRVVWRAETVLRGGVRGIQREAVGKCRGKLERETRAEGAPVCPLREFIRVHLFRGLPLKSKRFCGFGLEVFTLQNQALGSV